MTTLHSDDVRNVPDRMLNMAGGDRDITNMENDIYNFINVGVLLNRKEETTADGKHFARRFIDQICLYERNRGENHVIMVLENGQLIGIVYGITGDKPSDPCNGFRQFSCTT